MGLGDFILDLLRNDIEIFSGILIGKLRGVPSIKIRVEQLVISTIVVSDFASVQSDDFEHQIEIAVENHFVVLGGAESLDGGVHLDSDVFLSEHTGEFEDYFVDSHVVSRALGFVGKTNQFGGGLVVGDVELFGNVGVRLVDDEYWGSYAGNYVAFSERLALRGLGVVFGIVGGEVRGKGVLELADRILVVLAVEVGGEGNFLSVFALLAHGARKERKYHGQFHL